MSDYEVKISKELAAIETYKERNRLLTNQINDRYTSDEKRKSLKEKIVMNENLIDECNNKIVKLRKAWIKANLKKKKRFS